MKKIILFYLCILLTSVTYAQLSDIAKLEYTYIPKGNSNVGYDRVRGLFNYPIKIKEDGFLLIGLDYSNIDIDFDSSITSFDTESVNGFQILDINIGYTFKINEDWRFGARITPGFSSNLVRKIGFEDMVLSGDLIFIKKKKEDSNVSQPYRIIFGISYSGNRGIPYPIPFLSYYKKFHPKWSFNIGIPKSNIQYHFSKKSRLKLITELDGFTANIQEPLIINGTKEAEKINMSLITSGLRYEYKFTKHLELFFNAASTLYNNAELRDHKSKKITSVNKNNTLYLKTGIRFKL